MRHSDETYLDGCCVEQETAKDKTRIQILFMLSGCDLSPTFDFSFTPQIQTDSLV